jgi:hypothetical protein
VSASEAQIFFGEGYRQHKRSSEVCYQGAGMSLAGRRLGAGLWFNGE